MQKKRSQISSNKIRLLDNLDWDCQDHLHHKTSLNIIHWYPASFITSIPSNIIDVFTQPGDKIWDPFCGCGTTALESYRKGRRFYGNDICEIGVLITNAKLSIIEHRDIVDKSFTNLLILLDNYGSFPPTGKKNLDLFSIDHDVDKINLGKSLCNYNALKSWYSENTLKQLLLLRGLLESYSRDPQLRDFYLVVFLSVAKLASAQQKTWGHIADNVKPTNDQILRNNYDVFQSFNKKLLKIKEHINRILVFSTNGSYNMKLSDSRTYVPPDGPVDIVITSPPYPSMADYVTSQRLDYYWLGYTAEDINIFKKKEIGPRYLRHNSSRNEMYLENMKACFSNIINNIKSDGLLVLVFPEFNDKDTRKMAIEVLFEYVSSLTKMEYSTCRNIDENYRWAPFKKLAKESLSIWRKN